MDLLKSIIENDVKHELKEENGGVFLSSDEIHQLLKKANYEKEINDDITTTLTSSETTAARERLRLQKYFSKLSDEQIACIFKNDLLNDSTDEYILGLAKAFPEWSQDMKYCVFCFDIFDANRNVPITSTASGGFSQLIKGTCPGIEHEWEITRINNVDNKYLEGGNGNEKPFIVYLAQHCLRCGYVVSRDLCAANNNLGAYGDANHCQIGVHASKWPVEWNH